MYFFLNALHGFCLLMKCFQLFFSSSHKKNNFLSFTLFYFTVKKLVLKRSIWRKRVRNQKKRKKSLKTWLWIITQSSKSNWESANYPAPRCNMNKCFLYCRSSHKPGHEDSISDSKRCLLTVVATRKLSMLGDLSLFSFATVSLEVPPWSNFFSLTLQSAKHPPHLFQNSKA